MCIRDSFAATAAEHGDSAAAKLTDMEERTPLKEHVSLERMAPKQKREIGGVETRGGRSRAHVQLGTKKVHGPTRATKEDATADLNAARSGATSKEDVGRHLEALAATVSGLPATRRSDSTLPSSSPSASASAPAVDQRETQSGASTSASGAEQRQPPLESCAAASAAASAAEDRQPEANAAASVAKPATEQRRPALSDDGEVFRRLRSRAVEAGPVAVRIVDHASSSSTSVSSRVLAICISAGLHARADLSCDQPTDACGYIAADAVVRLRDAALAEAEGWLTVVLPDYANLAAVRRGEAALGRGEAERVLEVAVTNAFVRQYSHLEAHLQAHEEWWGGAVSLDNVLRGGWPSFWTAWLGDNRRSVSTAGEHGWSTRSPRGNKAATGSPLLQDLGSASRSHRFRSLLQSSRAAARSCRLRGLLPSSRRHVAMLWMEIMIRTTTRRFFRTLLRRL